MSPGMGGYSSVGGAVKKMIREEGFRGFYKGLYPNLLKVRALVFHN
jgi:Mitochondrial carrier protein